MTYAFTQDVPIDRATYGRIMEGLGPDAPDGLLVHLAVETDTGLRYIDVWTSEEASEAFADERLHPVVHALLREVGFDPLPPEPPRPELRLVHAWIPGAGVDLRTEPEA
jgi:hypothetical protein